MNTGYTHYLAHLIRLEDLHREAAAMRRTRQASDAAGRETPLRRLSHGLTRVRSHGPVRPNARAL